MASAPWDPHGEALSALRAIAANPQYGAEALSNAPMMTNLLKDLLPDAPREANVLVAAAGAGVAQSLRGYMAQGMDVGTATQLAAGTLADRTALTADACAWATGSLAAALLTPGSAPAAGTVPPGPGGDPARAAEVSVTAVATAAITDAVPAWHEPRGRSGLSLIAACVAGGGALATILACAFSFVHIFNSDGTYAYSESLFSSTGHYGGAWNWMGPVVAAALSIAAAVVLAVTRASWLRGAAAGVIAAFGAAVIIFFAAYEFTLGPVSSGAGPAGAEKLGGFGGFLLLVAGVLGIVAAARDRSVTPASAQVRPAA